MRWQDEQTRRRGHWMGLGLAAAALLLWPFDQFVFAATPELLSTALVWRIGSVALAMWLVVALRVAWLPPVAVAVGTALAWIAWTGGSLGGSDAESTPLLLAIMVVTMVQVPIPISAGTRALVQVAAVLLMWGAYFGMNPARLHAPYTPLAISLGSVVSATAWLIGTMMYRLQSELADARQRSQRLLHNVLPPRIAERLERDPAAIAEACDDVVVLFADLVGFTPRAAKMPPADVVDLLNRVFTTFDQLTEAHGLEKIKTIGDAYMAAAGLPGSSAEDVAGRAAALALAMRAAAATFPGALDVRIGLHSGPVVAGVIGVRKLTFDLWGDTVNTASRMESHSEVGRIQITAAVRARLGDAYRLEPRGEIDVKGKGPIETWFLEPR